MKSVKIDLQTNGRVLCKRFDNVYNLMENETTQHVFHYDDDGNKCESIFYVSRIIAIEISSVEAKKTKESLVNKLRKASEEKDLQIGEDLQIKLDKHNRKIEEIRKYLSDLTSRLRKLEMNKETEAKSVFSEIEKEDPKEEDPDYKELLNKDC